MEENLSFSNEDIAKLDFYKSMLWDLNIPKELQSNLITQSIQGHIASGHGLFCGLSDPDVFIQDVYKKLRKNSNQGRQAREKEITEVFDLVDKLIEGKTNQLLKSDGSPIMGFKPFENYYIKNIESGLKGANIMGCVDDKFWRADTIQHYKTTFDGRPLNIGYGKEYLVDLNSMRKNRIKHNELSSKAWSKNEIKDLKKNGIIQKNPGKNIENLFIRRNAGLGCCDDMMITSIGLLHGKDAMIMAWALDAMDTYTKFIMNPLESGYDQVLANRIHDRWIKQYGDPIAKPEEIREIIYLGAKENTPKLDLSSSHRRFIQTEKGQSSPTIENHLRYVETGQRPKEYNLGFTQVSSNTFYDTVEERFQLHEKGHLIKTPKEYQNERKSKNK